MKARLYPGGPTPEGKSPTPEIFRAPAPKRPHTQPNWEAVSTYLIVLTDGTRWHETNNYLEAQTELHRIRAKAITTYPPTGARTYGPDPGAKLYQFWERHEYEWREVDT